MRSLYIGVYLVPSQFEAGFFSTAHTDAEIDQTIETTRRAMHSFSRDLI